MVVAARSSSMRASVPAAMRCTPQHTVACGAATPRSLMSNRRGDDSTPRACNVERLLLLQRSAADGAAAGTSGQGATALPLRLALATAHNASWHRCAWKAAGWPRHGLMAVPVDAFDRPLAVAVPSGALGNGEFFGFEFEALSCRSGFARQQAGAWYGGARTWPLQAGVAAFREAH